MASIGRDTNGRKRILFVDEHGKRRAIYLGKATMRQAEGFKVKLEALIAGRIVGSIDSETARWVAALPVDVHAKLARFNLVEPRESVTVPTLGEWLDRYISERTDVKPATATVYARCQRHLLRHFGADRRIDEITKGDADAFRRYLIGEGLSENTTRRTCGIARQFFTAAIRSRLIQENPFSELKVAVQGNRARDYFLSREDAQRILQACPDSQWRTIFALCRFGGVRCPSEVLTLTWSDIDWDRGKMLVHSPKTEHHPDGGSRHVPLFPELRQHLMAAFEEAQPGERFVVTRYKQTSANLRTTFSKIVARAGLQPWSKLFQNLRASRETELAENWPEHIVCSWLGHTRLVARRHYLQVRDSDFERACCATHERTHSEPRGHERTQYTSEQPSKAEEVTPPNDPENADLPCSTPAYVTIPSVLMGGTPSIPKQQLIRFTRKAIIDHSSIAYPSTTYLRKAQ